MNENVMGRRSIHAQVQPRHAPEVPGVVGDEGQAVGECGGGYPNVVISDVQTASFEFSGDTRGLPCDRFV